MSKHFTEEELALLKGKYASLARKYKSTTTYVKLLAHGDRKLNTQLSKMIFEDIQKTIELFRPLPENKLKVLKNKVTEGV